MKQTVRRSDRFWLGLLTICVSFLILSNKLPERTVDTIVVASVDDFEAGQAEIDLHLEGEGDDLLSDEPLKRLFAEDIVMKESGITPIEVCVVGKNFRQTSLFQHNLLRKYGSGRFTYKVKPAIECERTEYRVFMVHFVKCCVTKAEAFKRVRTGISFYDITIVTGDEYCLYKDSLPHFRQYHSSQTGFIEARALTVDGEKLKFPMYMPLGPRTEFTLIEKHEILSYEERPYLFNFVGSLSSVSRKELGVMLNNTEELGRFVADERAFVHTAEKWQRDLVVENGYIEPAQYREVLLSSTFTLCPYGHNPEAYRIYEACEAGSIPILITNDSFYNSHRCQDSFLPFVDGNAPFIWLNSWDELDIFLKKVESGEISDLAERQRNVRLWYEDFLASFAKDFEKVLEWRHRKRLKLSP